MKSFFDKLRIAIKMLSADRVVVICLDKKEFMNYLQGNEYASTIRFNGMLTENAQEILVNTSKNFDTDKLAEARKNKWNLV